MSPVEYQSVVALYLRLLEFQGTTEFFDFSFPSSDVGGTTIRVVRFELPCSDGPTLWFTGSLGCTSEPREAEPEVPHGHHFIAFGSSAKLGMPELVAATYHFDRFVARLGIDHTFPLGPRSPFRSVGFSHGFVIAPTLEAALPVQNVGPNRVALLQVTPITLDEYELKRSQGAEALLSAWDDSKHDVSAADRYI